MIKDGIEVNTGRSLSDILKSYGENFLIERKVKECDNLRVLNPSSCNTIRVHTYRNRNLHEIKFMSAYVRIGHKGNVIDNASSGGIAAAIDDNGKLQDGCSISPYKIYTITDNGVSLNGYVINDFDRIVSTALKAHSVIPYFGIIGWDITVDVQGNVIIIEFNPNASMRIEQLVFKHSCFGKCQEEILSMVYKKDNIK